MAEDKPVLEPLSFDCDPAEGATSSLQSCTAREQSCELVHCIFCEECYDISEKKDDFLKHLVLGHKLVIDDVKLIADFKRYADYWRQRFSEKSVSEFCSVIQTNSSPSDPEPKDYYYLLCDALPEDKKLRTDLQKMKLESVLSQQQTERKDVTFSRRCLFCRTSFSSNRAEMFNHMAYDHNFNVGQPDNLVFTDEFLDLLEHKLKSLQCLYCERTFKDRHVLKEHMRKKQHKKINPKNTAYDRFYVINYLELGKNWETIEAEREADQDPGNESDASSVLDEWADWTEECGAKAVCLFCDWASSKNDDVIEHMKVIHNFELNKLRVEMKLSFYQQVKLINYIRRQIHQCICPVCQEKYKDQESVLDHMKSSGHVGHLPDADVWDQPQYFFPTYENDALLCSLQEQDNDETCREDNPEHRQEDCVVVAEDCPVKESILAEDSLRQQLLT